MHVSTSWKPGQAQAVVKTKTVDNSCIIQIFAPLNFLSEAPKSAGLRPGPGRTIVFHRLFKSAPMYSSTPATFLLQADYPSIKEKIISEILGSERFRLRFI